MRINRYMYVTLGESKILAPNEHKSEVRLGIQPVGTCQWHLSNLMPTGSIRISIIVH